MIDITIFIIDFILIWHITATIQSIYVHRSIAHNYIKYHKNIEKFFRFWIWSVIAFNWPGWNKHWATHHRKHHRYSDTKEDPHSPHHQTFKELANPTPLTHGVTQEDYNFYANDIKDFDDDLEKFFNTNRYLGLVIHSAVQYLLFGVTGLLVAIIYAVFARLFITFVGKWAIHKIGFTYAQTSKSDQSKIFFPITFLLGGEELHTNHHNNSAIKNFAVRWFEFDIGYWYCQVLVKLKLARWL